MKYTTKDRMNNVGRQVGRMWTLEGREGFCPSDWDFVREDLIPLCAGSSDEYLTDAEKGVIRRAAYSYLNGEGPA